MLTRNVFSRIMKTLARMMRYYFFSTENFLSLAIPIGIYFLIIRGWLLLPILIIGAVSTLFYTTFLSKWRVGEVSAGLGMGTLPVLGAFFVQSGMYTVPALIAAIPSGILVHNLLLLNEFPDIEPDKKAGRRTLPIVLGRDRAAKLFSAFTVIVYIWIVVGVIVGLMPLPTLLGLLTIPLALKAIKGALANEVESKLLPALGANILVVLGTQALIALGYIVATIFCI